MLNFKKDLALVLAAATTFTFAPVVNLGNAVSAQAAEVTLFQVKTRTIPTDEEYSFLKTNSSYDGNAADKVTITSDHSDYFQDLDTETEGDQLFVLNKLDGQTADGSKTGDEATRVDDIKSLSVKPIKTYTQLTAKITVTIGSSNTQTFNVTIDPASSDPDWSKVSDTHDTDNSGVDIQNLTVGQKAITARGAKAPDGTTFEITSITSKDPSIVSIDAKADEQSKSSAYVANDTKTSDVNIVPKAAGTTTLTITTTRTNPAKDVEWSNQAGNKFKSDGRKEKDSATFTVPVTVEAKNSKFTINGYEVFNTSSYTTADTSVQTVEITPNDPQKTISAKLEDAKSYETLHFYSVGDGVYTPASTSGGSTTEASFKTPKIASNGNGIENVDTTSDTSDVELRNVKVTSNGSTRDGSVDVYGLAKAFETKANKTANDETAFYVLVTNYPLTTAWAEDTDSSNKTVLQGTDTHKAALVKVLARKEARKFTSLKSTVDGVDKTVTSTYADSAAASSIAYKDVVENQEITLSTKDKKTADYTISADPTQTITPVVANEKIATAKDGKITAVSTGDTTVEFTAKGDSTHFGTATLRVTVHVKDVNVDTKITANDIKLTKSDLGKAQPIGATVSDASSKLSYAWVTTPDDKGTVTTNSNVALDSANGTLTFNGGTGVAYLKVTGAASDTTDAPKPAYITVNYTDQTGDAVLSVDKKSFNLTVGDTAEIKLLNAASGAAVTYESSDESVATVTAATSGASIEAVAPGVAVITVTDPGTDAIKGATQEITVNVKAAPVQYKNPAQVKGVKVTDKKGALVNLKFTKEKTNANVQYKVQKQVRKNSKAKWSKTSSKKIGSTKTTLSVKKGYQVRTRVKAFYYDANGKLHAGKYSKWVTKKTDKK